jgi:hypothetical protein
VYLRYQALACSSLPYAQQCVNGLIVPGVDLGGTCSSQGTQTATIAEGSTGTFGPGFAANTPGWSTNTVTWSVALTPSSGCTGISSVTAYATSGNSANLYTATGLSYVNCPAGFTAVITATRTDGSGFYASCSVSVSITQVS